MTTKLLEVEGIIVTFSPGTEEPEEVIGIDLPDVMEMVCDTSADIGRRIMVEGMEYIIRHAQCVWDLRSPRETRTTSLTRESPHMIVLTL